MGPSWCCGAVHARAKHQIHYLIIRHQCQREKEDEFLFEAEAPQTAVVTNSSGYLGPKLATKLYQDT